MSAIPHLQKQLRELTNSPPAGFRVEVDSDIFYWTIWFSGPQDTPYAGGQFKAHMTFSKEFPMVPPKFRIVSSFWHPNVYADGLVCISILHPPGEDYMNAEESAMMRWTPIQTIQSVLISIISLLSDPDPKESGAPANVDALVQYRRDRPGYDARCAEIVKKSLEELPENFVYPVQDEASDRHSGVPQPSVMEASDSDDEFGYQSAPPAVGPERYREELRQLRMFNVETTLSDDEILQLLFDKKGDVDQVLELLLS